MVGQSRVVVDLRGPSWEAAGHQGDAHPVECRDRSQGRGWTTEEILREYDHLTIQDIRACLAYASEILKAEQVHLLPA